MRRVDQACLLLAIALANSTSGARADFLLCNHKITNDYSEMTTEFELSFNGTPDFLSVDEFGRQANEFQYYISNDQHQSQVPEVPGSGLDVLIRGGEIARTGMLVVRLANGENGGPDSGGWGREVGRVPFVLNGKKLKFTVPWAVLGETDGHFSYGLLLLEHGASSDHRAGIMPPD